MNKLKTKTGMILSENELSTYPRPALKRDSYQSLNGEWSYTVLNKVGDKKRSGIILVPFAIESRLSKVEKPLLPSETLVYELTFLTNDRINKAGPLTLLHFEAVDYQCEVYLNNTLLGTHKGGYTSFSYEISKHLNKKGKNFLKVLVKDPTDEGLQERGKQTLTPHGMWYTATSGIYGSVWLESVPLTHLENYYVDSDIQNNTIRFNVQVSEASFKYVLTIYKGKEPILVRDIVEPVTSLPMENPILWSPEAPFLYTFTLKNKEETVHGYFGFRSVSIGLGYNEQPVMYLNEVPYFINGLLDQGYWPESGLTPPSEAALRHDILTAKSYGFNTLRKHIKVESNLFYHLCDTLGMLVIQDIPNGGSYSFRTMSVYPTIGLKKANDTKYKKFGRSDSENRNEYYELLEATIKRLRKHPSIVIWCPFNEGWGQFDAQLVTKRIRELDKTRLIDSTSGWFDQGVGDFNSVHTYFGRLKQPKADGRIAFISEFGGYSLPLEFHRWNEEKEYGYKKFKTISELLTAFKNLYLEEVYPLFYEGLGGVIYTQLSDVEEETNGLMTYDRHINKLPVDQIQALFKDLHY